MKTYNKLTDDQKCQIPELLQEGLSQTAMAQRLDCNQSSISHELKAAISKPCNWRRHVD
ncbi:helix-turn-helix domain-containing protein [Marinagarivorans algicola]|uniref:helix-turn-helix domain-containing protein n=1 Tax=Marinagarivorans algicola TaxID=1513270 RepID=UPI0009E94283